MSPTSTASVPPSASVGPAAAVTLSATGREATPGRRSRPAATTLLALLALLTAVLALAGCGAGGRGDAGGASGSDDSMPGVPGAPFAPSGETPGQDVTTRPATDQPTANPAAVPASQPPRKLARRAELSLAVDDLAGATGRVRAVATAQHGVVSAENTTEGQGEGAVATLTLSVPADRLDATLDALADLGRVTSRDVATEDVTMPYADTAARLATMRESVTRLRALMAKASGVKDIVELERELQTRQADLEALASQMRALEGSVAMSPVTVTLATGSATLAGPRTGFLAGLEAGWAAFTSAVVLGLTALGAALPFLVVLAAVGAAAGWGVRRHRSRMLPAATTTAATTHAAD